MEIDRRRLQRYPLPSRYLLQLAPLSKVLLLGHNGAEFLLHPKGLSGAVALCRSTTVMARALLDTI